MLPGKAYRINEGDFINIGLEQDFLVLEASGKNPPHPSDDTHINIRYAEPGVSEILDKYNKEEGHIAQEEPALRLEPKETDLETILEADPSQTKNIGRTDDNDYVIEYEGVTRKHCKVFYDPTHGWLIQEHETPSTSGTWLHPKSYFKAKTGGENSAPVLMHDGMEIKAHTYLFKFNIA